MAQPLSPEKTAAQAPAKAPGAPVKFATREQWLNSFIDQARPHFKRVAAALPDQVRVSIGFTSGGARAKAIGQCWSDSCSGDGTFEIFLVPGLEDAARIADILTHELVHAAVGIAAGHKAPFRRVATALGLEGKMTATVAGAAWRQWALPIVADLGGLPHSALDTRAETTRKKQGTRLLKCECDACGFVFRATAKWVFDGGELHCPDASCDGEMDVAV